MLVPKRATWHDLPACLWARPISKPSCWYCDVLHVVARFAKIIHRCVCKVGVRMNNHFTGQHNDLKMLTIVRDLGM